LRDEFVGTTESARPRLPVNVIHRVEDLPRLALGVEMSDGVDDEPRRITVHVPVVVADGKRPALYQLDAEPGDVRRGLGV
jgi:hypothetical protein